jgi:hypothetical protein
MKKTTVPLENLAEAIILDWRDRADGEENGAERFLMQQTVEVLRALLEKVRKGEEIASELAFAAECQLATIDEVESRARTPKHVLERHRSIGRRLVAFVKTRGLCVRGPRLSMAVAEIEDASDRGEEMEVDEVGLDGERIGLA